ncbi:hypothetical protein [Gracilibacillus sp. YIM 98692]|uniref:capsular polysaccharide export protein, LipB/KpsS family n=1 Tax=Gracilibacillus sp. YIM 98692 TaxID=2663532 RepID=UPI0013D5E3D8|nr:hypothetical protein [Gracilibacillus sp. YIM 98692]
MNTYVKNYWSQYLDFIQDFQTLNYKGFTLSYIIHFPSLIRNNTKIWNALYDKGFSKQLRNRVKAPKEIQEVFNDYVQSHKKKPLVKNKHGKVVVNYDTVLRFPEKTFKDYFDRSRTMIIMAGSKNKKRPSVSAIKNKQLYNLPTKYLSNYQIDTKKDIVKIQNQARNLLKSYQDHHLYQEKNFQSLLLKKIAEVINCIEQSLKFLDEVSASCLIVSTTHSYISRILALAALEKGIPTICMQHGIIGNEFGFTPKIATVDAVYGNFEVDWYKARGAPKDSVKIIGHPRFDYAFLPPTISRNKFFKQLGVDKSKKTLLIVVRGNRDIDKWRILIKTISKQKNLNILIKDFPNSPPHPLTKEFPFVHSTQSFDLYNVLHKVDCVVSYTSTVGLEAMLAQKPVFILGNKIPSYTGYYDDLDELVQTDPKKLGKLILKYFNDPIWASYVKQKREEFIRYAYPDTSMSSERLKKLIDALTS